MSARHCPSCKLEFELPPSELAPQTLSPCGHTICVACNEAVSNCDRPPTCLVCSAPVSEFYDNAAFRTVLACDDQDANLTGSARREVPAPECSDCGMTTASFVYCTSCNALVCTDCGTSAHVSCEHNCQPVDDPNLQLALGKSLKAGVSRIRCAQLTMERTVISVVKRMEEVQMRQAEANASVDRHVEAVLAALRAEQAKAVSAIDRVTKERLKALQAQLDGLEVSMSQLSSVLKFATASSSCSPPDALSVIRAVDWINSCVGLTLSEEAPPVCESNLSISAACVDAIQHIQSFITVSSEPVRAQMLSFSGPGLETFVSGDVDEDTVAAVNQITVMVPEDQRHLVTRASLELRCTGRRDRPIDTHHTVDVIDNGTLSVVFRVKHDDTVTDDVNLTLYAAETLLLPVPRNLSRLGTLFRHSSALDRLSMLRMCDFESKIRCWLPHSRFHLMYRSTLHGESAEAVHDRCDGKGAMITIVRATNGSVFAAYLEKPHPRNRSSRRSRFYSGWWSKPCVCFLVVVANPFDDPVTVIPRQERRGYCTASDDSLHISGGFLIWGWSFPNRDRVIQSICTIGRRDSPFEDVLGRGCFTLTGSEVFKPAVVEVWQAASK